MIRSCLGHLSSLFLVIFVILVIAVATERLVAEPLQRREIPYFVDAAGPEYDVELEASLYKARGLSEGTRSQAISVMTALLLKRWRVYLRNDGTWAPDPAFGYEDYGERHYPVEYVLPLGYRGAFQMAWDVRGAPPLPIINNKIEIYIPASGVFETSSAQALRYGTLASPEHQFYFEHDGKRTVIPHEPLQAGQVGISFGTTGCREMPGRCYTYFVGSKEEWQAATSAKCPTPEAGVQVMASGHECSDVPPGSTQPVSEIVPPPGEPAHRGQRIPRTHTQWAARSSIDRSLGGHFMAV